MAEIAICQSRAYFVLPASHTTAAPRRSQYYNRGLNSGLLQNSHGGRRTDMDPVTLATAAVEALIPYFGKGRATGGQAVAEELGKKSSEIGESILKVLWARWKNKP